MKKIARYVIGAVLLVGLVGGSTMAFAAQNDFFQRGSHGANFGEAFQHGPGGQVHGIPRQYRRFWRNEY